MHGRTLRLSIGGQCSYRLPGQGFKSPFLPWRTAGAPRSRMAAGLPNTVLPAGTLRRHTEPMPTLLSAPTEMPPLRWAPVEMNAPSPKRTYAPTVARLQMVAKLEISQSCPMHEPSRTTTCEPRFVSPEQRAPKRMMQPGPTRALGETDENGCAITG